MPFFSFSCEAKKRYIHRAVETCGLAEESLFLEACGLLNYLLFDIKHMDAVAHKDATDHGNESIIRNVQRARAVWPDLTIHLRTPLIPGFNDSDAAVLAMAAFARELGVQRYELLPYHRMGSQKYATLGREYPLGVLDLNAEHAAHLCRLAAEVFAG